MGMFDTLRCRYPLPSPGANDLVYQTKDLACFMDEYELRDDGTLWHEEYDIEDQSDPHATGLMRWCGAAARVRRRWEPVLLTGEVRFYTSLDAKAEVPGWIEWSAYFVRGQVRELHLIERTEAASADPLPPTEPR